MKAYNEPEYFCDFCHAEMKPTTPIEITVDHGFMMQHPSILTVDVTGSISRGPSDPDVCIVCKINALKAATTTYKQILESSKKA